MSARTIRESEQYPVYSIDSASEHEAGVAIPDTLAQRYEAAREEWEEVQGELADLYDDEVREWEVERVRAFIAEHGSFFVSKTGKEAWREAVERKGRLFHTARACGLR